ncbi:erythrocyte membrane protein 1, PfEMP1, putative [Plasmodium sp. DRC-Itaito]|nr:erythrocyte membrane protein 1, PfEMP1, putative [Plasmodium sp. DRC-Itaito]
MGSRGSKFRDDTLEKYKDIIGDEGPSWGYWDYILFLTEEINNQSWDNLKYDRFLSEKGWDPRSISNTVNRICAWEKVQKDIFQAVMDSYSTKAFTWDEKAEKLIENARNIHFHKQTCDKFNHQLVEEIDIVPVVKKDSCNLHTVEGLCIPGRRSKFQFETISENIKDITSGDQGNAEQRSISALTTAIGTLAKQITDNIVNLKNEYQDNKDLCKFLRRTYADYKDIIESNDIVDNKTSKGLQCLLKETKSQLKEPNSALSILEEIFKKQVEKKLSEQNVYLDVDKKSPCLLDDSDYTKRPQCLRFLEEWFEDYSKEKERFETNIKDICLEGKTKEKTLYNGIKYKIPCSQYCYEYERLLNKRKACYNDYISKCKKNLENDPIYKVDTSYQSEVERIERITKDKYKCSDDDCKKNGKINLDAFFDPKKLSTNKRYCCGCINNPRGIKEIFGTKDNKSTYIDAILNKLKICATTDNDLNGSKNGKIRSSSGSETDICNINFGDSFLKGEDTCKTTPCDNYYLNNKDWVCDSTKQGTSGEKLKEEWSDGTKSACLPPRTQRLCLGRIYDKNCIKRTIEHIDTSNELLTELIIAAKHEGIQLYSKYIGKDSKILVDKMKRLCNAAKYSFSDLGDIVKGTNIWESNDTNTMETNLRKIFAKLYRTIRTWKLPEYEDKDGTYKKLREVWWNTNREHIWKALVCSIKKSDTTKSFSCISENKPPNIDYMPQFLRWMIEWSEEFCEEKKTKFDAVKTSCELCKSKGKDCVPSSGECKLCDKKCKDYQTFIKDAKNQYTKQKLKYENQINDITNKYKKMRNVYDDNIQKNTEDEFYNFLYNTNRYSGYFLNDYMKNKNLCSASNVGGNHIDFTNVNQTFNDTPNSYENVCSCSKNISQSKKKPGSLSENSNSQNIDVNIKAYLNKDACLINETNDGVYNTGTSFPCKSKESRTQNDWKCDFNQSNGSLLKKSWSTKDKGACLPPRTQEICLGNLDKDDLKKKIGEKSNDGNDKNRKLLEELVLAAKYDGEKLWDKRPNKNDNRSVCLQLRNSYADYGDLVKGRSIWENGYMKAAENNIGEILKDIFKHKFKTEYQNDDIKLRKAWWEANKEDVWDAITCGIPHNEIFVITKNPKKGGGIEYSVTGKCGYSQKLPDDDELPQFLRWFKEWSNDFCEKYTEKKTNLEIKCRGCDATKEMKCPNNNAANSICKECVSTCGDYKSWINNQQKIYNEQKQKYTEKISEAQKSTHSSSSGNTDNTYFENLIDEKINSAEIYLESNNYETHCGKNNDINFNNVDTAFNDTPLICKSCEEKKKKENPNIDGTTISTKKDGEKGQTRRIYTNDITNNCMRVAELAKIQPSTSSNAASSSSTFTVENNNQNNQNIAYNITVCSSADPSLYGAKRNNFNSKWTIKLKKKSNNKDVLIDKKSSGITYEDSVFTTTKGKCSGKPCKYSDIKGKKWIWEKSKHNSSIAGLKKDKHFANTIGIPPRTQVLCFGNIHGEFCVDAFLNVTTKEQLLMEWVIAAKLEGENLKNNYRNNTDKLCRAVKYSFADIGDLIKGTSIWENKWTNLLETNLQKIFQTLFEGQYKNDTNKDSSNVRYQSLDQLREIWWNTNKKFIWHALYEGADLGNSYKCSGIDENVTPTIDHIPQFLRFMQEWIEHLCEKRKTKINQAIHSCKACKEEQENHNHQDGKDCWKDNEKKGKDSEECTKCNSACEEYKKFISGKDDKGDIPWRQRWKNIYEKYMDLIKDSLENNVIGTMKCGLDDRGKDIYCPKADISSFFKNLYDEGYTTPSSYLSVVIKNNICGDDKAFFARVMDDDNNNQKTNELTAPYGSVFGDRPSGYKYACECRIPSREEICDDKGLYSNDWKCGNGTTSGTITGTVEPTKYPATVSPSTNNNYEICKTKNMITTGATNTVPSVVANNTLNAEDHTFFNWFDIWYHDIQTQIDKYANRVEKTCSDEQIKNNIFPGNNHNHNQIQTIIDKDKCKECKGNCECYNLWTQKIENQWEKQKKNYNIFNNKRKDQHGGHNATRTVSLGNYLFFSCWEKYIKQHLKGDWEQIKSLDTETLDLLEKKCGKSIHDGQNIFEERINHVKKKGKDCEKRHTKCMYDDKDFKCEKYEDVDGCNDKYYDGPMSGKSGRAKNWECKDKTTATDTKDVCVPPRTQTLCVANMADSSGNIKGSWTTEEDLKKYLQNVMKKETERLYEYYKARKPIITSSGENDTNGFPKNFCKAAERTYNDFKNIVTGNMLSKAPSIKAIGDKIKNILEKSGNSGTKKTTPHDWWNENEYEFWEAIKCGIKNSGSATGNECGYHPPSDTDDPFVWWFKEWGQQFCIERNTRMKEINEKCSSSEGKRCDSSKTPNDLKTDCKKTCDAYQKFIEKNRDAWNKQKSKYEREHSGMKAQELLGLSYPECSGTNFENIFGNSGTTTTSSTTQSVSSGASVKPSASGTTSGYGDASDICSCDEQTYKCENNTSSCRPKGGDLTSWRTGLLKTGKDNKKLQGVYAPPRRQKLCLANLYPIIFGNGADITSKKNTLLNRLQIVAEREAYYLWKQHTSSNPDNVDAHRRACCSIRASFFDIGDIVKGTDLWDDESKTYIDQTLKNIFEEDEKQKNRQMYAYQIRYARKKWWEGNRKSIWKAMKCGVKNAMRELDKNGQTYDKIDCLKDKDRGRRNFDSIPTPQFVRWLEEWTQQFCDEYTKNISELQSKCGNGGNNDNCNSSGKNGETTCKTACTKYNDWIKSKKTEWDGMSKYYQDVKGKDEHLSIDRADYHAINQPTAIKYLNQICKETIDGTDKCCYCEKVGKDSTSTTGSDPLEHMDNVVNRNDTKYAAYLRRCNNCYIQHITEQINKIQKKLDERRKKEDEEAKEKYAFDCGNSGNQSKDDTLCEKLKENTQIDKADELKVPIDPDKSKNDKRNKENGSMNCGGIPSNESDYIWKSKGKGDYNWVNKLNNNIQIPPRRQKLCYNGLDGSKTEHELRYKLLRAAANDAYNLGIKYPEYKNHYGVEPCKALEYSFRDYYNIIMGTDNLEDDDSETNKALKDSLQNYNASNSKKTEDHGNRKKFWDDNKTCLWRIMKCGYKKGKEKVNNGTTIPECNGDIPDDTNTDQLLSWLSEWYEDYCHIRTKLKFEVENNCKVTDDNYDCKTCPTSCNKYQEYMKKKKEEWEDQENYYSEQKSKAPNSAYNSNTATNYIKSVFTDSGSNGICDGDKDIKPLNNGEDEVDQYCGCKNYIEDKDYKTISGKDNCKGLKKTADEAANTGNWIKWDNSAGGLSYLNRSPFNKDPISPNVYIPPRKQKLCFKDLDSTSGKINNKEELRKQLMKVAATEGYNLGEYYKKKKEKEAASSTDADKYAYDVEACNAMKYSFYDLGDIILGYDMVEQEGTGTENNLKKIFKNGSQKTSGDAGKPGSTKRREFWNNNKECVWEAMKCGYRKGTNDPNNGTKESDKDLTNCKDPPQDSDYPIGKNRNEGKGYQFLRWFTEWAEDFCVHQKKQLETLKNKCNFTKCSYGNDNQKKECLQACWNYQAFLNKWKKEYRSQNIEFEGLRYTNDIIKDKEAPAYLKEKCKGTCSCIKEADHTHYNKSFEYPPDNFKDKCNCKISDPSKKTEESKKKPTPKEKDDPYKDLDTCPFENGDYSGTTVVNNEKCKNLNENILCMKKYENELDNWTSSFVKNVTGGNEWVLMPPRRRYLCTKSISSGIYRKNYYNKFMNKFLSAVYTEGILLAKIYKKYDDKALQAMKYSFADYGDIIKGKDLMDTITTTDINKKLEKMLKNIEQPNGTSTLPKDANDWWKQNRKPVWNSMLCGYKRIAANETLDNTWCEVPKEDETPQFLRWLEEWAELFCNEKQKEAKKVVEECIEKNKITKNDKSIDKISDNECKKLLTKYRDWYINRNTQWKGLKEAYKNYKKNNDLSVSGKLLEEQDAEEYVKKKCKECDCNYNDLEKISQYEKNAEELLKELKNVAQKDSFNPKDTIIYKILTFGGKGPDIAKEAIKAAKDIIPEAAKTGMGLAEVGLGAAKEASGLAKEAGMVARSYLLDGLSNILNSITSRSQQNSPNPVPREPDAGPLPSPIPGGSPQPVPNPPQSDQPINTDILNTTLPVGISFALGSIALLFYMKKKPQIPTTKLFRVIDIPQNDYSIPTNESTNRYVPYSPYKGKTYIYVEGEETDDYLRDISSSDLTSSESEYEEMDINDIYKPLGPKYKTLIELVLKPSTNNNVQDTYTDDVKNNSDIPINKWTEEEWNELKKDFISQYLQNIQKDLSNENKSGNTFMDSQPNILPNNMEEKPFITSIQDRFLDNHEKINYDIDWNIPKNINRTTNNMNDPKYVTSNDKYSGIDLINDSLNSGNDIYDELLKRKENELFGTKHSKNTSTNRFAKQTGGDPIMNQLVLFDKWLDRHRDMCNQWNNKEEMLSKLNEEWKNENKEHVLDIPLNDNAIHKINDETYNMINENTNKLNDITSLEDFGSTNIPYSALIRQNNDSQRQNLRTNISMDIHFDENNNNVTNEDDQLENSYNF